MQLNHLLSSFQIVAQADSITRYSRDALSVPETVLQHTGWVALWLVLAGENFEETTRTPLDWKELLRRAVVHDLDEVGTGDVPRTTKYGHPAIKAGLDEFSIQFIIWIEKEMGLPPNRLLGTWAIAKDDTIEGDLIAQADLAAVVFKVWDEVSRRGNFAFARVAFELKSMLEQRHVRLGESRVDAWFRRLADNLLFLAKEACDSIERREVSLGSVSMPMGDCLKGKPNAKA